MNLKEIIRGNTVRFHRYRQQVAYYTVNVPGHDADYLFPVPLSDVGDATLGATEKAIYFMHWIRQALTGGTFVRAF
jgi:hypothetical protein